MSAIEIQYIVMNIWFYYPKYSGGQHFCILMCVFVGVSTPKYWEKNFFIFKFTMQALNSWSGGEGGGGAR